MDQNQPGQAGASDLSLEFYLKGSAADGAFREGGVVIRQGGRELSSRGPGAERSFLVFLSLGELLEGLRIALEDKWDERPGYLFEGIESEFRIRFHDLRPRLTLESEGTMLSVDLAEFCLVLLRTSRSFLGLFADDLPREERKQLRDGLERFEVFCRRFRQPS